MRDRALEYQILEYRISAIFERGGFDSSSKRIKEKLSLIEKQVEITKARYKSEHLKNKDAIENNKRVRERIEEIMSSIGIPTVFKSSYYKTSRSRYPSEKKERAGYLNDLEKIVPIHDNYEKLILKIDDKLSRIKSYAETMIKKIEAEELEKKKKLEKEEFENKKHYELASLKVKYSLEPNVDADGILNVILNKCKYLNLADSMESCRGDFSLIDDVIRSLNAFSVESEIDQEIHDDIEEICANYDGDGRCFRDCEYNYSVLFKMVDPDIYSDYEMISKYTE